MGCEVGGESSAKLASSLWVAASSRGWWILTGRDSVVLREVFLQDYAPHSTPKEAFLNSKRRILQLQKKNYSTPKEGENRASVSGRRIARTRFVISKCT